MREPYFIVISTAKENKEYQDRKNRKKMIESVWIIILALLACGYGYSVLWAVVHS